MTNVNGSDVSVIDTATNAIIARVPVGYAPTGVAVTPSGDRVYVANSFSSDVSVIDASVNAVIATVNLGRGQIGALGQFIVPAAAPGAIVPSQIPTLSHAMLFTLVLALAVSVVKLFRKSLRG